VLIACWSAKGGSGTTVVATALALTLARRSTAGDVLLVDLAGDVPAVLGVEPPMEGVSEWLAAGPSVPPDAFDRLAVRAGPRLRVVAAGSSPMAGDGERLAAALSGPSVTVVDCGVPGAVGLSIAAGAAISLLVTRPCYLALRRAVALPLRPSGVVLVDDGDRALGRADVEAVLGVPVRAVVRHDPAVARAVDAGLLPERVPRLLERALRKAA
jgi:hypothetical protein